jgi:hypothetical protein
MGHLVPLAKLAEHQTLKLVGTNLSREGSNPR